MHGCAAAWWHKQSENEMETQNSKGVVIQDRPLRRVRYDRKPARRLAADELAWVNADVARTPPGEYTLPVLIGPAWGDIHRPRAFGMWFRASVAAGMLFALGGYGSALTGGTYMRCCQERLTSPSRFGSQEASEHFSTVARRSG